MQRLKAEVSAQTFVPDFYLFTGLNAVAQAAAPDIQTRFNYDFRRIRNPYPSWYEAHDKWLHQGLRDGLSIMEVSWVQDRRVQRYLVHQPAMGQDGMPQIGDDGELVTEPQYVTMETTVYDGVVLNPVLLKDCLFSPNEAESPDRAAAVWIYHRYYKSDLAAMVEDGIMDEEWVNAALSFDPQGYSDIASRFQGVYNYTAGGQLDIGIGQGQGMASDAFAEEGPLGVWVGYTRQYDFDHDGWSEPNIVFIHEISGYMLGWMPDGNLSPVRLIFAFAPFPRPDSIYGFGVPELVGPFQREATLQWNQRNDAVSTRLEVPLLIDSGIEIKHSGMEWGNGRVYQVKGNAQTGALRDLLYYPDLAQVPLASFEQEQQIRKDADDVIGIGVGTGGSRQTAKEIGERSSGSDLLANQIAMYLRLSSRQVFEAIWSLTLQYGFNEDGTERNPTPGQTPFTREILSQPFKKQVAGEDDPLDKQSDLDTTLGFYKTFAESPFVQSNLMHRYNLERTVAGKFGITGLDGIFGTPQEAMQMQQSQEQTQKQEMALRENEAKAKTMAAINRGRGVKGGAAPLGTWQQVQQALADAPPPPQPGAPQGNGKPAQQQLPGVVAAGAG